MRRFLLLTSVLPGIWLAQATGQDLPRISVIAHRGAAAEAPENSLPAIEAAIQMGCDMVEIDVRLSQDGKPVVIHDATVDRTTDGRGRVDQLPWARLSELHIGGSSLGAFRETRIPLLEDAIDLAAGKIQLYLDLKVTQFEPAVRVVQQRGFSSSVLYHVYRPQDIDRIRSLDRAARVIIDADQLASLPGALDVLLARHPGLLLCVGLQNWSEPLRKAIEQHGSGWFVTVLGRQSSLPQLRKAMSLKPSGILTDSSGLLLELLGRGKTNGVDRPGWIPRNQLVNWHHEDRPQADWTEPHAPAPSGSWTKGVSGACALQGAPRSQNRSAANMRKLDDWFLAR